MAWIILVVAKLLEAGGAIGLKYTDKCQVKLSSTEKDLTWLKNMVTVCPPTCDRRAC